MEEPALTPRVLACPSGSFGLCGRRLGHVIPSTEHLEAPICGAPFYWARISRNVKVVWPVQMNSPGTNQWVIVSVTFRVVTTMFRKRFGISLAM